MTTCSRHRWKDVPNGTGSPASRRCTVCGETRLLPIEGHKCRGARMSIEVSCECGWTSHPHSGGRARSLAFAEWRTHVRRKHVSVAEINLPE